MNKAERVYFKENLNNALENLLLLVDKSSGLSEKDKENIETIIGRLEGFIDKAAYERMIIHCIDMSNLLIDIYNKTPDISISAKNLTRLFKAIYSLRCAENALWAYFITQQEVNNDKE